ncbi:MAG: hypothetical protein IKU61_01275 [Clostridia bacterium]|nr:hypothetical protein [Clostridia bacterium]
MKSARYFNDKVLLFLTVCVLLSFFAQVFEFKAIVDLIYIVTLVLVFALYFLSGYANLVTFLLIILVGFSAIVGGIVNNADFFTHIVITWCIFICIDVGSFVKMKAETYKKISNLFLISAVILLAAYYFGPLKTSYFRWTDVICLNFPNPNAAGLWLTCFFVIIFYSSFLFDGKRRFLYWGVALALLPIITATQSRNSFYACLFMVGCVILTKVFKIKKVPNWILLMIAILPLVVFFFYIFVVLEYQDFWINLFSFSSFGKGIGTRESIWLGTLENFWHCFWVGDYAEYYNSQQHNSLMTIFCRFGALTTILLCTLLNRALKKLQEEASFYATLGLSAILFTGCFEASVFVGIAGLYLMLLLVPACAIAGSEIEYSSNTGI